jgi:predicted acylesterase/phospholipase RssA
MGEGMGESTSGVPDEGRWHQRKHAHDVEPRVGAKRVLCIDGGGIRGIIPAMLVAEIEQRTGRAASDLFDLIAGTSTGGIIAMGLVTPGPDGKPAFAAADGVAIYEDGGPKIFARAKKDLIQSMGGLLHERYHADGLEALLHETFGDLHLSDALTDVLVAAYEITRRETFMFSSRRAGRDPDHDFLMRDAVRSTSAAPTFFEPSRVVDPAGTEHVFIDGAVYANSPAMYAFGEVEREHFGCDVLIASVGAGSLTHCFEYDDVREWGAAHWARPLLEIVLDGSAETNDHVLLELLGSQRYYRFQQELCEASDALDDVKPSNLAALKREGQRMVDASSERIDALCEQLAS